MVTLAAVLVLALAGLTAVTMQLRCLDAAREAARLAARGDRQAAIRIARDIAPTGATVQLRSDGAFVVAVVTARSTLLPTLAITAESVSGVEPPG